MKTELLIDIQNNIKKIYDSVNTIDLKKYLLLNGIVNKNNIAYGEYIFIEHDKNIIHFYHIPIKFNGIMENSILTRKKKDLNEPIFSEHITYNDLKDIEIKLLKRIAKYFTLNEFCKVGISPTFLDKNFKILLDGKITDIDNSIELFNQELPMFYLNLLNKCKNMDDIYKIYKKKRKDVQFILKDLL